MSANYLDKGSYNFICDTCGQKYKREYGKLQWDNLFVCVHCFDPKHPWLEPLPIPIDSLPVPVARPRPTEIYNNELQYMGIWGLSYRTDSGYFPTLNWEQWTGNWGTSDSLPFTAANFPLV